MPDESSIGPRLCGWQMDTPKRDGKKRVKNNLPIRFRTVRPKHTRVANRFRSQASQPPGPSFFLFACFHPGNGNQISKSGRRSVPV